MPIRTNPLKQALAGGRALIGTRLRMIRNPAALVLLKRIGLDFVVLDLRQPPVSTEDMAAMTILARALDLPMLVDLPVVNREWITRALDAGAWGVHASEIDTEAAARAVVDAARHAPLGNRGTFEPGPQNDYVEPPEPGELVFLNAQVQVWIEIAAATDEREMDRILSVEGISAVAMERTSVRTSDSDAAVSKGLIAAAARHRRATIAAAASLNDIELLSARGVSMIVYQSDADVLRDGFARNVATCRAIASRVGIHSESASV